MTSMTPFRTFAAGLSAVVLTLSAYAAGGAKHSHEPEEGWPFTGPVGQLETDSVQRGYQVYREVCAVCHGMKLMSYRNLGEAGGPFHDDAYPNANDNPLVKAFAAEYEVFDQYASDANEDGYRPARTSDPFKEPYPDEQSARAGNGGALPPDLSVITKARGHGNDGDGASYVYSLLTGYDTDTMQTERGEDGLNVNFYEFDEEHLHGTLTQPNLLYYNEYFEGDTTPQWDGDPRHIPYGGFIAMAPPLVIDGQVEYMDGTEATIDQMAYDVAQFLQWAGEPKQDARKSLGLPVIIYLFLLAILLWFSFHRIWRNVDH